MGLNIKGFIDYGKNDMYENTKKSYSSLEWDEVSTIDYDEILISSHEYMYEIIDLLDKKLLNLIVKRTKIVQKIIKIKKVILTSKIDPWSLDIPSY